MRTWLRPLATMPGGHIFAADWVVYGFVIGGLMLDLLVVPLLLWRRTRLFAFVAAVLFNLINALIFEIGIFPWLMLGALFIFFRPTSCDASPERSCRRGLATRSRSQISDTPQPVAEGSSCPSLSGRKN